MNTKHGFVYDIAKGSGGLNYYNYWVANIRLRTKQHIVEAINLKLKLSRYDKIMKKKEIFNYKKLKFEEA